MIKIRRFRKSDTLEVKNLVTGALTEIFGSAEGLSDLDNIKKEFEVFFVAEENGRIVGTIGIKNEGDARISRMYVRKSERGKGIGNSLFEHALKYCRKKFKRIFLSTYPQMKAERFYEKCGFRKYKQDERIWMELDLS
jgi:GNAT superfamily N-acetyltransferase